MNSQLEEDRVGITAEDLQALKDNWFNDPCWDIEDTEGFEEYKEELLTFRKEQEAKWKAQQYEKQIQRIKLMENETGITVPVAQHLFTFAEIEKNVKNSSIGEASQFEMSMIEISQAQTRATLLLAAQVKRVGDVLAAILIYQD